MIQTEEFPVKDLHDRYDIGRTWFYETYLPAMEKTELGRPLKRGNKSFVTLEQLKFLDAMDIAIKENRLDEFLNERAVSEQSSEQSGQLATTTQSDPSAVISILAEAIIQASRQADPLAHIQALQKACDQGWLLSSSELAPLLKLSRISGQTIARYGFICTRLGRNGAESAWKITRA